MMTLSSRLSTDDYDYELYRRMIFTSKSESYSADRIMHLRVKMFVLVTGLVVNVKSKCFFLFFEPHKHQEQALRVSSSSIILSLYYEKAEAESSKECPEFYGIISSEKY